MKKTSYPLYTNLYFGIHNYSVACIYIYIYIYTFLIPTSQKFCNISNYFAFYISSTSVSVHRAKPLKVSIDSTL